MNHALQLKGVSKRYQGFALEDVTFSLPKGSIMGLIGENGAGKSTTLKAIMGLIQKDAGQVSVFGESFDGSDCDLKEKIGVVMDSANFAPDVTVNNVNRIMKHIYRNWNEEQFWYYQRKFKLPKEKPIKDFSRGMRMKLPLAVALSHDAKLLILDEATSGLDPISRDELLDVFLEFIQDEEHSILMSSHILSDLEKACDYITFIHEGRVYFSESKDVLLEKYGMFRGAEEVLNKVSPGAIVGVRRHQFGVDALLRRDLAGQELSLDPVDIETIMLYHVKHVYK